MTDILSCQGRQYLVPNPEDPKIAEMLKEAIDRDFQVAELTIFATEGNTETTTNEIVNLAGYAATNYFSVECIRKRLEPLIKRCWGVKDDDSSSLREIQRLVDASIEMGLKAKRLFQIITESTCSEKRTLV